MMNTGPQLLVCLSVIGHRGGLFVNWSHPHTKVSVNPLLVDHISHPHIHICLWFVKVLPEKTWNSHVMDYSGTDVWVGLCLTTAPLTVSHVIRASPGLGTTWICLNMVLYQSFGLSTLCEGGREVKRTLTGGKTNKSNGGNGDHIAVMFIKAHCVHIL